MLNHILNLKQICQFYFNTSFSTKKPFSLFNSSMSKLVMLFLVFHLSSENIFPGQIARRNSPQLLRKGSFQSLKPKAADSW